MSMFNKTWRRDEGSIDFIQLFVGLLIISIAAVGTFQALFYGYEMLDFQMRYRKAISIARSYVEYWQGRIHTDFGATAQVMAGNMGTPEILLLDERDPTTSFDDIDCEVAYDQIDDVDLVSTGVGVDHFLFNVILTWYEPNEPRDGPPHEIGFNAAMVPAAL